MPRHVNSSLKAVKVRGAPPPWIDWVHKCGPVLSVAASAAIFYFTFKYTVEPVYKRALLEESNAQLETKLRQADKQLSATRVDIDTARNQLVEQQARLAAAQSLVSLKESDLERAKRSAADQLSQTRFAKAEAVATEARLNAVVSELSSQREALGKMMAALSVNERKLVSTVAASISGQHSVMGTCYRILFGFSSRSTSTTLDEFDGCVLKSLDENRTALTALSEDTVQKLRATAKTIDAASATRYAQARNKLTTLVSHEMARRKSFDERRAALRQAVLNSADRSRLVDLAQEENVLQKAESESMVAAITEAWAIVQSGLDAFHQAARE